MDPDYALEELITALEDKDADTAIERAQELREWLLGEGFEPDFSRDQLCRLLTQLEKLLDSI